MEIRRSVRQFLSGLIFSTVCTVVFVGLIARILHQRDTAGATLGSVVFFAVASIRLRKSLEDTTISFATLAEHAEYISCAKRFLTETKVEPRQPLHAPGTSFSPEISFENVSFRYEGQQHDALRNITFTIKAGETIAIVGENGSGKSTLVRLIAGIYQPQSGTIRISGHDISRIDLQSLHQQIAFVFQDFNRYYTSLLENVAYGDWSRYSQYPQGTLWQELQPCVMSAGLGNELKKMPRAEETILGRSQGEYEPSGGIWQRIAIARAFARQAPLLIMDEPSSAIDARAEYEMFRTISSLAEGRTTILISHRFSTVSMASRIFVMEAGQLVEAGGHEELMQLNGRYATLYNYHRVLQAGE
jgi:ATP-binding cassette subfamily B protein